MFILGKFCPDQLHVFKSCLKLNDGDENKCPKEKKKLNKCAFKAFRQVNNDTQYTF